MSPRQWWNEDEEPAKEEAPNWTPADKKRAAVQRESVWNVMRDGEWRSLAQLHLLTSHPESSISARLRDFRKEEHGGHLVERRMKKDGGGAREYRIQPKKGQGEMF